jgi:hypothetical protein
MRQEDMPLQNGCLCQIDFIGDLPLSPPENVMLVENDRDYVQACRRLSKQFGAKEVPEVWVRSRNHFIWLKDFLAQIDLECLFQEKTAKQVLADEWNVSLPDWLDDGAVLEQGLLDLEVATHPHDSFVNRLLTHFFGDEFRGGTLNAGNLVKVTNALADATADTAFKKYPILQTSLEAKCKEWAVNSSEKWVKSVCERIPENFQELWRVLSCWSVLNGYPVKFLGYVLTAKNTAWVTKLPPGAVAEITLEPTAREEALTQIEMFFKDIKPQVSTSDAFLKVLACTSGRFVQEFKYISDLSTSNQFTVSIEDVRKVQDKFKSCPGVTASRLGLLTYCAMPNRPTLLDEGKIWSAKEWIRWTVDEYVPYRAWQLHNNHYDDELEHTVQCFSDWYVKEYATVQKDPDLSLIYALKDAASAESARYLSVILLIDCLPLQFVGLLQDALRNYGFSMHDRTYRFAPLPTTTTPNKAIILGGQWDCREKQYESVLKTRAEQDWKGQEVIYVSSLKTLSELEPPTKPAVVVLNFVDGDDLLHEDVQSKNTTYEEELYRLFNRIAEAARRLSDTWTGKQEDLSVHVVTDHGACRILDEEKHSFDSGLVNKLFSNEKHRFSSIDAAKTGDVPENLWNLGYKFQQPFYADGKVYFLPKGHNTVRLPGKGKGFLHGGSTPEEVIVSTVLYKTVKVAWKHPFARFLGLNLDKDTDRARFYVQRIVALNIELQNPNSSTIRVISASILAPDTDLKECETPSIEPGQTGTLRMECYFKKAAIGQGELVIEIAYEIGGETHTLSVSLDCLFRSAVTTGFSLKDLS